MGSSSDGPTNRLLDEVSRVEGSYESIGRDYLLEWSQSWVVFMSSGVGRRSDRVTQLAKVLRALQVSQGDMVPLFWDVWLRECLEQLPALEVHTLCVFLHDLAYLPRVAGLERIYALAVASLSSRRDWQRRSKERAMLMSAHFLLGDSAGLDFRKFCRKLAAPSLQRKRLLALCETLDDLLAIMGHEGLPLDDMVVDSFFYHAPRVMPPSASLSPNQLSRIERLCTRVGEILPYLVPATLASMMLALAKMGCRPARWEESLFWSSWKSSAFERIHLMDATLLGMMMNAFAIMRVEAADLGSNGVLSQSWNTCKFSNRWVDEYGSRLAEHGSTLESLAIVLKSLAALSFHDAPTPLIDILPKILERSSTETPRRSVHVLWIAQGLGHFYEKNPAVFPARLWPALVDGWISMLPKMNADELLQLLSAALRLDLVLPFMSGSSCSFFKIWKASFFSNYGIGLIERARALVVQYRAKGVPLEDDFLITDAVMPSTSPEHAVLAQIEEMIACAPALPKFARYSLSEEQRTALAHILDTSSLNVASWSAGSLARLMHLLAKLVGRDKTVRLSDQFVQAWGHACEKRLFEMSPPSFSECTSAIASLGLGRKSDLPLSLPFFETWRAACLRILPFFDVEGIVQTIRSIALLDLTAGEKLLNTWSHRCMALVPSMCCRDVAAVIAALRALDTQQGMLLYSLEKRFEEIALAATSDATFAAEAVMGFCYGVGKVDRFTHDDPFALWWSAHLKRLLSAQGPEYFVRSARVLLPLRLSAPAHVSLFFQVWSLVGLKAEWMDRVSCSALASCIWVLGELQMGDMIEPGFIRRWSELCALRIPGSASSQDLHNMIWALSALGNSIHDEIAPQLAAVWMSECILHLGTFNSTEMCNVLISVAAMTPFREVAASCDFVKLWAVSSVDRLDGLAGTQLVQLIHALGKLNAQVSMLSAVWLAGWLSACRLTIPKMMAHELVTVIFNLSKLGVTEPELQGEFLSAWSTRVMEVMSTLKARELANLVLALSHLGVSSEALGDGFDEAFTNACLRVLSSMKAFDMVTILSALATNPVLSLDPSFFARVLATFSHPRHLYGSSVAELSRFVWAVGRLGIRGENFPPNLMTDWLKAFSRHPCPPKAAILQADEGIRLLVGPTGRNFMGPGFVEQWNRMNKGA